MLPWYVRACAGALAFCLDHHFFSHAISRGFPFGRPASQPTSSPPPKIPDRTLSTPHYPHFLNKWNVFFEHATLLLHGLVSVRVDYKSGRQTGLGRSQSARMVRFWMYPLTNADLLRIPEMENHSIFFLRLFAGILRELSSSASQHLNRLARHF